MKMDDEQTLYKTRLCRFYRSGDCKETRCKFAHGVRDLRESPMLNTKMCKFDAVGVCRFGSACRYQHRQTAPKTLLRPRRNPAPTMWTQRRIFVPFSASQPNFLTAVFPPRSWSTIARGSEVI